MQSWTLTLSRYCIYRVSTELSCCAIEPLSGKCNDKLWLSWRLNEREMHKLRSSSENQSILSRVVSLFNIWMRREAELIFSHLWIGFSILINSRKNRRDEMEGRVREREKAFAGIALHLPVRPISFLPQRGKNNLNLYYIPLHNLFQFIFALANAPPNEICSI